MAHRKLLVAVVVAMELTACGMTASTPPARGFMSQLPRNQLTEADKRCMTKRYKTRSKIRRMDRHRRGATTPPARTEPSNRRARFNTTA